MTHLGQTLPLSQRNRLYLESFRTCTILPSLTTKSIYLPAFDSNRSIQKQIEGELHQKCQELDLALQKARSAADAKTSFLANMYFLKQILTVKIT
jgi:hypothetical protein